MNLKKNFLILLHLLINHDYRLVRRLRIFDPGYYQDLLRVNPEFITDDIDLLWGYLKITGNKYLLLLPPDHSWRQMPDPHPLFDTSYYITRYFPDGLDENPLIHYLKKGWKLGYQPGPFLEPSLYRVSSGWNEEHGDPLTHYTHVGAPQGLNPGSFFDVSWYLDNNPTLEKVKTEIVKHYKLHGARNGKSPIPCFNPNYYLEQVDYPRAERDPLTHYISTIADDLVRPNKWFDPEYYEKHIAKDNADTLPLKHFLTTGVHKKYYTDESIAKLPFKPLISIVVPVFNCDLKYLNNCIRSVLYQSYPYWELCMVDDGSSNKEINELLLRWSTKDDRIKLSFQQENTGIAAATNAGVEISQGDYIGFLDHDDELAPNCLFRIVETINELGAEVIYTDEVLIGRNGTRFSIFHKPDFNRELLLCHNYMVHFLVVATHLLMRVGGLDSKCDGAQDYDLVLKLSEVTTDIYHIPEVLYHWRASETSTNINHDQKRYAHLAGKRALETAVLRRTIVGTVDDTESPFYYRLCYNTEYEPRVSVLLNSSSCLTDRHKELLSLQKNTQYTNCDYYAVAGDGLTVTNASSNDQKEIFNVVSGNMGELNCLGFFEQLHKEVTSSKGEYLAFLGSDIINISATWLKEFTSILSHRSEIGLVSGRISFEGEDGSSYIVPDITNDSPYYLRQFLTFCTINMNWLHCSQQVTHGNAEFCLLSRALYDYVGGLDYKEFPNLFALHDLALKITNVGKKVVYIPYAAVNFTKNSINSGFGLEEELTKEKILFQNKWRDKLKIFDPFYNPGILDYNGIDREKFLTWLSGGQIARFNELGQTEQFSDLAPAYPEAFILS